MGGRLRAVVVVAVVLLGSCGGDDDAGRAGVDAGAGSSTTSSPAVDPNETSSSTRASTGSSSTTAPARTSSTTAGITTTTGRVAPAPGLTFMVPGTYRYATTGSFTTALTGTQPRTGEATLVVDPPSGTDQHSVRRAFGRVTDQVLRLDATGAYLVSLRLTDTGIDKEVRPSPPGLALPADAAPGRTWSWQATSTDGGTQVQSTFRAVRTESVAVGGQQVSALVVEVNLSLTGDVTVTSTQTLWVVVDRRLIVRQDDNTQGRAGLITFSSTASDVLVSLTPS